ncbi:MAG: hypothetical protein L0206_22990 [Actinobacteria bacterium]|nr:hypothetical protein [Actinomycetota bacterium]
MTALQSLGLPSLSEDRLDCLEGLLVDDWLVPTGMDPPAERDLADVRGVAKDPQHVGPGERNAVLAPVPLGVQDLSDRLGAHPFLRIHAEHAPDNVDAGRIRHDLLAVAITEVAERCGTDDPAPFGGRTLHPGRDPLDDRGPFELGEDGEHLQHHLAGGSGGVERLGCRAKRDAEVVEVLTDLRELANTPGQAVHAVHEQQLVDAGPGPGQRLPQPGTVQRRAGGLVGEPAHDPPRLL